MWAPRSVQRHQEKRGKWATCECARVFRSLSTLLSLLPVVWKISKGKTWWDQCICQKTTWRRSALSLCQQQLAKLYRTFKRRWLLSIHNIAVTLLLATSLGFAGRGGPSISTDFINVCPSFINSQEELLQAHLHNGTEQTHWGLWLCRNMLQIFNFIKHVVVEQAISPCTDTFQPDRIYHTYARFYLWNWME